MIDVLRKILHMGESAQAPPAIDLQRYDAGICELDRLIGRAEQARSEPVSRDPVTGLVRGDYQRERPVPTQPRRKGTA